MPPITRSSSSRILSPATSLPSLPSPPAPRAPSPDIVLPDVAPSEPIKVTIPGRTDARRSISKLTKATSSSRGRARKPTQTSELPTTSGSIKRKAVPEPTGRVSVRPNIEDYHPFPRPPVSRSPPPLSSFMPHQSFPHNTDPIAMNNNDGTSLRHEHNPAHRQAIPRPPSPEPSPIQERREQPYASARTPAAEPIRSMPTPPPTNVPRQHTAAHTQEPMSPRPRSSRSQEPSASARPPTEPTRPLPTPPIPEPRLTEIPRPRQEQFARTQAIPKPPDPELPSTQNTQQHTPAPTPATERTQPVAANGNDNPHPEYHDVPMMDGSSPVGQELPSPSSAVHDQETDELEFWKKQVEEKQKALDEVTTFSQGLSSRNAELSENLDTAQAALSKKNTEYDSMYNAGCKLQRQYEQTYELLESKNKEIQDLTTKQSELSATIESLKKSSCNKPDQSEEGIQLVDDLQHAVNQERQKVVDLETRISVLQGSYNALKAAADETTVSCQNDVALATEEASNWKKLYDDLQATKGMDIHRFESDLHQERERNDQVTKEAHAWKEALNNLQTKNDAKIQQLQHDHDKLKRSHQEAISVLERRLQQEEQRYNTLNMDAYLSAVKWKDAHDCAKTKLGEDIAAQQYQIDSYMKKLTALTCELQTKTSENDVLKLKNDTLTREKVRLQSSINLANMSPTPRPSSTFAPHAMRQTYVTPPPVSTPDRPGYPMSPSLTPTVRTYENQYPIQPPPPPPPQSSPHSDKHSPSVAAQYLAARHAASSVPPEKVPRQQYESKQATPGPSKFSYYQPKTQIDGTDGTDGDDELEDNDSKDDGILHKRKRKARGEGVPGQRREIVRTVDQNECMADIRRYVRNVLEIEDGSDAWTTLASNAVTFDLAEHFVEEGLLLSVRPLRVYLEDLDHPYNIGLSTRFADEFVKDHDRWTGETKYVAKHFLAHMRYLKTELAKKTRILQGSKDVSLKRSRRSSRRAGMFRQRLRVATETLIGPLATSATAVLKRTRQLCVSSDDSGRDEDERIDRKKKSPGKDACQVIPKPWRSASLVEFFKWLDYRARLDGTGYTRIRKATTLVASSTRPAVAGLPRNWYDETWLHSLPLKALEALKVAAPQSLDVLQGLLSLPESSRMRRHEWDGDEYNFPLK